MRKLTDRIKYELNEDGADLFARLKSTGKFAKFGTCHESVVFAIKENKLTFNEAITQGLIIPV